MAGLFKKKVKIIDYCKKKNDFIFSSKGDKIMNDLFQENIKKEKIQSEKFRNHFIAVHIQLMGIAFSRTISRDLRKRAIIYNMRYLKDKNASNIDKLGRKYNSAFGSSIIDGIQPMAEITANEFGVDSKIFYDAYYGTLEAFFMDIEGVKLVK